MPSSQPAGQAPGPDEIAVSHVSGGSTTPLPQVAEHSASFNALQPGGQQPSPVAHAVIGALLHAAAHPEPTSLSRVHAIPSLQPEGQAPGPDEIAVSQVSGGSTTPLPHEAEQSLSFTASHPDGQHPSPDAHAVMVA